MTTLRSIGTYNQNRFSR